MKLPAILLILALGVMTGACANNDSGYSTQTAQSAKEVEKEDGSTVAVSTAPDGTKTEVRRFKSGDVARVTRTTPRGGESTATVEFSDGRKVELEDKSDIERAMDATSDAIVAAANKTWDATKEVGKEIGDKTEDVAGKTVDTGKKVGKEIGKGAKRGAEEVADKAEDAADAVAKGAKTVGKKVKKAVKKDDN
jgi:hypothetical protein